MVMRRALLVKFFFAVPPGARVKFLLLEENTESNEGWEKKRKNTDNPREGWEDGTPPPHRDFKERSVVLAVAHPRESASSYLFSQVNVSR